MKDIYDLEMNENLIIEEEYNGGTGTSVRRVPGGWIYYYWNTCDITDLVFVPWVPKNNLETK